MMTCQLVLTDSSEELVVSVCTLDIAQDLKDGDTSVIISDLLNSQLFMEIWGSDFTEYEDAKGDGWRCIQWTGSQLSFMLVPGILID